MISRPHPCDFVFVDQFFNETFHRYVPLHETNVRDIETEQDERLVPLDLVIPEEVDERNQADRVEEAVSEQRPPGERENSFGKYCAHPDYEEDVEHGRTDDGTDTDVVEWYKDADDTGEQFRSGSTGCHESSTGHVVLDLELFDDDIQSRDEELIAHDGESDKHVDDTEDMQKNGPRFELLIGEQLLRKQRVPLFVRNIKRGHGRRDKLNDGFVDGDILVYWNG